jgi:amino acid transporter
VPPEPGGSGGSTGAPGNGSAVVEQETDGSERDRLTVSEGLAALSLDALSSVAYGPEAIVIVLATVGARGLGFTFPVTVAIVVLLAVLTSSYRQVIAAFPNGGSSYAVSGTYFGRTTSLIAAASLIVDYTLNVAVGISAGIAALTSAVPSLYAERVLLCAVVLVLITAANLYGVAESARLLILPTLIFVVSMFVVIVAGFLRSRPLVEPTHASATAVGSVGLVLLLKAFASGCSALTGVEAIANAVPNFRKPQVRRAQQTEVALGLLLGLMLLGLSGLISKYHVAPNATITVLSQLVDAAIGHNVAFFVIQGATVVLLALAANTSFGGLPVLAALLARDDNLPHVFALRADRQVYRYGVLILASVALVLLVISEGDTQRLVPVFAIGVFVGFTLAQAGMVLHWRRHRNPGWVGRACLNGFGAVLTAAALVIEAAAKFSEGGWLVFVAGTLLVLMFELVNKTYRKIGRALHAGEIPDAPIRRNTLVVVSVARVNLLTQKAIASAVSLGEEVRAITVTHPGTQDDERFQHLRELWDEWDPGVPLIALRTPSRSITRPIVDYLNAAEQEESNEQVIILIPEMELTKPWQRLLQNQRGAVIDRAVRKHTGVVIARLRFRIDTSAPTTVGSGTGR